jgi:hypothetical protein
VADFPQPGGAPEADWHRLAGRRVALVLAHPGHELRLHGCLERLRPVVHLLTDGSGHLGRPRVAQSADLIGRTGARLGSFAGRLTDHELYETLMRGRSDALLALTGDLTGALAADGIEVVIADALEGYNPGHDLCRLIADAAVARIARGGAAPENYSFPLDGAPGGTAEAAALARPLRLPLDAGEFARKRAAAARYETIAADIQDSLNHYGWESFRTEWLFPAGRARLPPAEWRPFYEIHGERQVASGFYREPLRYREHFLPAARALRGFGDAP